MPVVPRERSRPMSRADGARTITQRAETGPHHLNSFGRFRKGSFGGFRCSIVLVTVDAVSPM